MKRKEQIDNASYEYTGEYTNSDFHFGAEWADNNPSEEHIAMYLGKKDCLCQHMVFQLMNKPIK